MLDPGSLDPCVEIVAHFTFIALMELSSEEGCDVLRFYGVDGSPANMPIDWLEILLMFEDDVGCIFSLHDAPVIVQVESFDNGTKLFCKEIESMVQDIHFEGIAEPLGKAEIRNPREHIVHESKVSTLFGQTGGQPSMPIEIDLKAKGAPGGDTYIAKAQLLIDKIEVVVETLAISSLEESFVGLLIVPGFIGLTGFHG